MILSFPGVDDRPKRAHEPVHELRPAGGQVVAEVEHVVGVDLDRSLVRRLQLEEKARDEHGR